jgi:hypothetical protein
MWALAAFQFPDLFTIDKIPWTSDQLVVRPLPNHMTAETQKNTYTHQTSIPEVEFESTIKASERAKIVHALESLPTVTGLHAHYYFKSSMSLMFHIEPTGG